MRDQGVNQASPRAIQAPQADARRRLSNPRQDCRQAGFFAYLAGSSWAEAPGPCGTDIDGQWLRGWGEAAAVELRRLLGLPGLEHLRRRLGFNFRGMADVSRMPKTSVVNIWHGRGIKDPAWHIETMVEDFLAFLARLDTAHIPASWVVGANEISGTDWILS